MVRIDPEDHAKDNQIRLLSICTTARILTADDHDQDDEASHPDILSLTIHNLKVIPCAGIVMGLLAGIISSIAAFMVKLLPNVNPIQIVVSRS